MTGPFKFRLSSEHPGWASESSQSASSKCLLFLFLILPVSKDEQNSDLEEAYSWIRFDENLFKPSHSPGYETQIRCIPFKLKPSPFQIQSFAPYFMMMVATDSPRKDHPKIKSPMTVANFHAKLSSPTVKHFLHSMLCLLVSGVIRGKWTN